MTKRERVVVIGSIYGGVALYTWSEFAFACAGLVVCTYALWRIGETL